MTANPSSKKHRVLTKERQIELVVKLLTSQPQREKDLRARIEEGRSLLCHGLEFSLEILRQSLERFQAQRCDPKGVQSEVHMDAPNKKRKCGDENQNPADNKVPNRSKGTPGEVDEALRPKRVSPARPAPSPLRRPQMKASPRKAEQAPPATSAESHGESPEGGLSIKALKARLLQHGLPADGCVEKAELQALWEKFDTWRRKPLSELQDHCEIMGGPRFQNALDCAKYLTSGEQPANASHANPTLSSAATKVFAAPAAPAPPAPAAPAASAPVDREQDAKREAKRILLLRRESHLGHPTSWGFAVLGVPKGTTEVSTVQRAYRTLMRKLHPDRANQSEDVGKAIEKVREAKEACERGLSKQEPPEQPRELRSEALCKAAGQRRFQLSWTAPTTRDFAPVHKYVVAAHDPAYGKALTITVLEPDYSQELRSFVSIEHLTSYVMAEQDLQKMPKLWTQSTLQVQVAAANEAGQSAWTTLKIPLTGPSVGVAAASASPAARPPRPLTAGGNSGSNGFASAATMRNRMQEAEDVGSFDAELRKISGHARLRAFLEPQKKGLLVAWLRSVNWTDRGSKQDLVARVIFLREAMVC